MKKFLIRVCLLIPVAIGIDFCFGQSSIIDLNQNWQFRKVSSTKWYKAEVPGNIHTDLLANKLIPDPFYRDNESKVQWVENETWEYQTTFATNVTSPGNELIHIVFYGLDTYAEVFLNGEKIISADNMFIQWSVNVSGLLRKINKLVVRFQPASKIAKAKKKAAKIAYPDNERVFVRKAQYQFGWDWGPRLVTCGIWKNVYLKVYDEAGSSMKRSQTWNVILETKKDSIGESFQFIKDGKPVYIKGANWIPADNFLPRARKLKLYEKRIRDAKEANINMLRVWGGGIYEDDIFYQLCEKYGIMVWQDFMFAGAMYPGDEAFLKNVEAEVRYQVTRLRGYSCIVIWCGNNEIEEAWFNWGWQKQFNYSVADSLKLWNDYKKIFHELIPSVLKELDPQRPYWPSSPSLGWGRDSAYLKGDVHYWGVWWGKQPVEKYNEKVGRFNSEYGMQGMPDMKTIRQFALPTDFDTSSKVMKVHQKHPFGYENIKLYIENKFRTPKTFEDLVYVSQLMQADAIRTAITAHRTDPKNSGTIFWQWNDCWPVTSWSAIDYYGRKKALYYEVKRRFAPAVFLPYYDPETSRLMLTGVSDLDTPVLVKGWFFDFVKGEQNTTDEYTSMLYPYRERESFMILNKNAEDKKNGAWCFQVVSGKKVISRSFLFAHAPKEMNFPKANLLTRVYKDHLTISTDKFAYGVFIDVPDGVELEDNYFNLLPGETRSIKFSSKITPDIIKKSIRIKSLVDTYK
jgi:beta-mannosidase